VKYIAFILSLLASPAFAGGDCATALVRFANQDAATYAESRCASEACQAAAVDDLTDLIHVEGVDAFNRIFGACSVTGACQVIAVVEGSGQPDASNGQGAAAGGRTNNDHGQPANTWHGTNDGGASANPNGVGLNGGNGIHDIDENPGQSGVHPADFATGTVACELHGGMNGVKKPCQ